MAYLSAKHIAVKKDQDRVAHMTNKLVLCDGIGEFVDSAKAAELTIKNILFSERKSEIMTYVDESANEIVEKNIVGGTTLISACIDRIEEVESLTIAYIGNGSVFHLNGDFFELPSSYNDSNRPYRFSNLMVPNVDKEGVLLRHISHHSSREELIPSFIELSLTGCNGDIILLFTDGISSLEEDIIVVDDQQRIWRNQSENVSTILNDLHEWLKNNHAVISQEKLDQFLELELTKLKNMKKLEDDASIGIIFTDAVLDYYKKTYHAI